MTLTVQVSSSSLEAGRRFYRSWSAFEIRCCEWPHFSWFAIWRNFYVNGLVSRVAEVSDRVLSYENFPRAPVKDRVGKPLRKRNVVERWAVESYSRISLIFRVPVATNTRLSLTLASPCSRTEGGCCSCYGISVGDALGGQVQVSPVMRD